MTEVNTEVKSKTRPEKVILPLPPTNALKCEMDAYVRFMRHLRHVPNNRMDIKILSAIQFTADMTGLSDAHVSKILIDLGLRAPRMAFPSEFLAFVDQTVVRGTMDPYSPSQSLIELKNHWDDIGEDKFAAWKRQYAKQVAKEREAVVIR